MKTKTLHIIVVFLALSVSCNREQNDKLYLRLQQWDEKIQAEPAAVADSLRLMSAANLSGESRAYYGLLKTIADDKTYVDFESDSLINSVQRYFERHRRGSENHVRALTYQAVVRYRMGAADSTVLLPLKEAEKHFKRLENAAPTTGSIMCNFIGQMLDLTHDRDGAAYYFEAALYFAREANNARGIFDACQALCWNKIMWGALDEAGLYLRMLETFNNLDLEAESFRENVKSAYYSATKEYEKALASAKEEVRLLIELGREKELSRPYFSLSDLYDDLGNSDSAMHYAVQAILHIPHSTSELNYTLYENAARISEKTGDYEAANAFRRQAVVSMENAFALSSDKKIMELNRKYDLLESENKTLKAQRHNRFLVLLIMGLLVVSVMFYGHHFNQKLIAGIKQKQAENLRSEAMAKEALAQSKALKAEAVAALAEQQAQTQTQILFAYELFLLQYAAHRQSVKEIAAKARIKTPALADEFDETLKEMNRRFNALSAQLFTPAKITEHLHLSSVPDFLNQNDCLVLFMLACRTDNGRISALLNTTPDSFKVRKHKLKRKITEQEMPLPDKAILLNLFN